MIPDRTYEEAAINTRLHFWNYGVDIHRIAKCGCDKCASLRVIRSAKRKEYLAVKRKERQPELLAYMSKMRNIAVAEGRPKHIKLAWCGAPWLNKDYEFYKAVTEFAASNSITVNELVRLCLSKQIKKGDLS